MQINNMKRIAQVLLVGALVSLALANPLLGSTPPLSPHGALQVNRENSSDTRPNFVFMFPDETQAEILGVYGHPIVKTPNYDRFVSEKGAAIFNQAHVLHTQCSPSRCLAITGRYMHVMGHRTQTHLVREYENNWLRYLKDAGYHVLFLGKNDMLSQESFTSSVSEWHDVIGVERGPNSFEFGEAGYYSFQASGSDVLGNDTANHDYLAVQLAVEFMKNKPPEPFVIWLPGIGAHPPYGAPQGYQDMYNPDDFRTKAPLRPPNPPGKPRYYSPVDGIPAYRNLTKKAGAWDPESSFYKIHATYAGAATYTDWVFGQLLDGMDAAGMSDRTVTMLSSDHGDFSGNSDLVEKWPGGLDDMLTRVPLMINIPGVTKGNNVTGPVQSFDAWATMMDLAGVNASHVHFARSLRQKLEGQPGAYPQEDSFVFSEGGFYYDDEIEANDPSQQSGVNDPKNLYYPRYHEELSHYPDASPRAVMIKNLTSKLVWRPRGQSELYDLEKDPKEVTNLFGNTAYANLQSALQEKLLYWYTQTGDVTPENLDPRGLSPFLTCKAPSASDIAPSSGMPVPAGRLGSMSVSRGEALEAIRGAARAGSADVNQAMEFGRRLRGVKDEARVPLTQLLAVVPIEHCPQTVRAQVDPADVALFAEQLSKGGSGIVGKPFTAYCQHHGTENLASRWKLNVDGTLEAVVTPPSGGPDEFREHGGMDAQRSSRAGASRTCLSGSSSNASTVNEPTGTLASGACDPSDASQQWTIDGLTGHIVHKASGLCLDAGGHKPSISNEPLLYSCHDFPGGSGDQQWELPRVNATAGVVRVTPADNVVQGEGLVCLGLCLAADEPW